MKYEKYINLYTQYLISEKNLSKNTINNYLIDLKQFFNQQIPVDEISNFFGNYISNLRTKEFSLSTINRKISSIKNFLKFLQSEKIINKINLDKFESFNNSKKIPKAIDKKTIQIIFKSLNKSKLKNAKIYISLLNLIYLSGLRASEAINLKWTDINKFDASLNVYGKGSKERKVYIPEYFLKSILILKKDSKYIFNINRKPISIRTINKFLKDSYRQGLISLSLSSHMFRHSFATTMLENNADIRHIQKLLGHSSISTTEIYTKVAKSLKKSVLDTYHPLKNKL